MTAPRIDLCVLLAGGLKPSPLAVAAGCSVLDLSADGRQTILEHWMEHLAPLGSDASPLPVRVVHGPQFPPTTPDSERVPSSLQLCVEMESKDFRGPAGVVKDAAENLPPDATVLVVEASRWFGGNLDEVLPAYRGESESGVTVPVTVTATAGGAPGGIVVLRRDTLDLVSDLGFMDLKEQWLGKVSESGHDVRVVKLDESSPSVLLRDRADLLASSRCCAELQVHAEAPADSVGRLRSLYSESEGGYFQAVAPNSTVEPNTSIVDSVIMGGATVRSGAIVARSLICPGALVDANEVVVDQVRAGSLATAPRGPGRGDRPG